jgi:tetratricopeptide (TPR) repeat protein
MRKVSSSEDSSQSVPNAKSPTVERGRTGVSVIDLCDAGRYREAQLEVGGLGLDRPESALAVGMVEIYRGNLGIAKDYLTPIAFGSELLSGRARVHLAHAYYLSGEANEAKALLKDAPESFGKFLLKALIEPRPKYALRLLDKCAAYDVRPGLAGRLHNQRAMIYRKLCDLERAIPEYEAALYFFEQDHSDCLPLVLNNLAGVYLDYREFERAHHYADRAISLLNDDLPHLGKALDQKAQILLAGGDFKGSRLKSEQAARLLRQSGRKEWLVESLLTYARALRSDKDEREFAVLQEASDICRHLQRSDLLIDVLQRRHQLSLIVSEKTERLLLETALDACKGSFRAVAVRLKTTHPRITRLVKKHGLTRIYNNRDS